MVPADAREGRRVMRWTTLDGAAPRIIAHRGASGLRPEHTMAGYQLALAQGADVIEPDLVPSADGVLFARHEPILTHSTDIAARPDFAERKRDGDWHSADLSAAQINRLRALQPYPGRSREFDGRFAIPRFAQLIGWAAEAAQAGNTEIFLYPEIKHPSELAARGIDPVGCFIEAVRKVPAGVRIWVQCFEPEPLRRVFDATGLPCALLLDAEDDWHAALAQHGDWLARLGVNKQLLEQGIVAAAHARGLAVDAWTFRDDALAPGCSSATDELQAAMKLGVDGLFCDFPATGIAARDAA